MEACEKGTGFVCRAAFAAVFAFGCFLFVLSAANGSAVEQRRGSDGHFAARGCGVWLAGAGRHRGSRGAGICR